MFLLLTNIFRVSTKHLNLRAKSRTIEPFIRSTHSNNQAEPAQKRKGNPSVRLDKYLKVSRIIKRRTIANEACDAGRVLVNGKIARASYDVKENDLIEINLGRAPLLVRVIKISEHVTKDEAAGMYAVELGVGN